MTERTRVALYGILTLGLLGVIFYALHQEDPKTAGYALACLAALYVQPPQLPASTPSAMIPTVLLIALSGCRADYEFLGFRSSSFEMTPQSTNPTPAGMGGLYTKSSDGKPRLVDNAGAEYPSGEARHIYTYAGAPPGAVVGDCWTDSTDTDRLWCKEGAGNIRQRYDGTDPGPVGCGGTESTGCFTMLTIAGAPAEAFFSRTCTLTSAAAITPVNCLSNADVPAALRPYLLGWRAKINGATPWATTANCWIQDTSGTANIFVTTAVAAMTANAFLVDGTANVTQQAPYSLNTGGTLDLGLEIACDANGTGSNWVVTLFGVIK